MKPKIGIRPTIDGRWGGVRESLEAKTMAMANAAKELIEANVFYQDGNTCRMCYLAVHHRRRCGGRKVQRLL